jgi:hypothetical protein
MQLKTNTFPQICAGKQPIGDDAWNRLNAPDLRSIEAAVHELRMVCGIPRMHLDNPTC